MENMKIGVYVLTNEPEYLEEWLEHHRKYGFDHFFVYIINIKKNQFWKVIQRFL